MKVLVTGATGFVGQATIRALQAHGHAPRAALRLPRADLGVESTVVGGIGPGTDWHGALRGVDAVVHLAARVHVMRGAASTEFDRVNTEGTLGLARAAARAGVRRFVFVSTIKVNGEATTEQVFRADDPPAPQDSYARSKFAAEQGLLGVPGLEPAIIRPPLIHGAGAKGNLLRFCRLAELGLPVPFAAIRNRRDLLNVENLSDLIARCLIHPNAAGRVFLASDGEPLSTPEIYRTIAAALNRPARMVSVPVGVMRALGGMLGMGGEIRRLTESLEVDTTPTRQMLDWWPPHTAAAGLAAMARAYRDGRA